MASCRTQESKKSAVRCKAHVVNTVGCILAIAEVTMFVLLPALIKTASFSFTNSPRLRIMNTSKFASLPPEGEVLEAPLALMT